MWRSLFAGFKLHTQPGVFSCGKSAYADGTPPAPSFSPDDITGLAIWLDAQDAATITQSSNLVSQWNNKGNTGAGNATQGTGTRQPLLVASGINSLPAIRGRHDGVNGSQMQIADSASLDYTNFSVFAVVKRVGDLNTEEFIGGKWNSAALESRLTFGAVTDNRMTAYVSSTGASSTDSATPAVDVAVDTPIIIESHFTANTSLTASINGANTATDAAVTTVHQNTSPFTFFARATSTAPFDGMIGEYLFYTDVLSTENRTSVRDYLADKWGITL